MRYLASHKACKKMDTVGSDFNLAGDGLHSSPLTFKIASRKTAHQMAFPKIGEDGKTLPEPFEIKTNECMFSECLVMKKIQVIAGMASGKRNVAHPPLGGGGTYTMAGAVRGLVGVHGHLHLHVELLWCGYRTKMRAKKR
jgi:hypothetical protein